MWIILPVDGEEAAARELLKQIMAAVEASRFRIWHNDIEVCRPTHRQCRQSWRRWAIKLGGCYASGVTLKRSKDYCGQHPGPCLNLFVRKHRKSRYLEGADWVGFNDGLNDLLDKLGIAADVFSYNRESLANKYFIRKGRCRRSDYLAEYIHRGGREFVGWEGDDDDPFTDCCGRTDAPRSEYPDGTPGYACWTVEDENRLRANEGELEHVH